MEQAGKSPPLKFDRGTLLLRHPPPKRVAHLCRRDARGEGWRCDALHYKAVAQALNEEARAYLVEIAGRGRITWPQANLPRLRPDQEAAAAAWMQSRRGVLVMPTGTGKTEVALHIMHRVAAPTLVVAPVRDLMYQWHRRIQERLGYDAGIIGDNTFNKRPVSVTTYDSACIYMQDFGNDFGLLIFDECHHLPGPMRSDAARMSTAPFRLGLTATPERSDGREAALDGLIGPVVFRFPLAQARGTILADYEVQRIPVYLSAQEQARYDQCSETIRRHMLERRQEDPEYSGYDLRREYAKSPEARQVLAALRAKQSIEDRASEKLRVLADLFRLHPDQRVLVFTGSNAMAREVSVRFLIPCLLHHCRKNERRQVLEGFRDGRFRAIVANQVLDEGVDLPEAKIAVVLGGLSSAKQAKQRLGRILRRRGQEQALLYEVVCRETKEEARSRRRRNSDAYQGTRHFRTRP
ncbi:MAG: DEAD/DEAH box helicase family protein [Verrucomicrobiota bacterium]